MYKGADVFVDVCIPVASLAKLRGIDSLMGIRGWKVKEGIRQAHDDRMSLLEDEMLYNLTTDPDEKRIFLLTNKNTETLIPKLKKKGIEFVQISEDDFFNEDAGVPKRGSTSSSG